MNLVNVCPPPSISLTTTTSTGAFANCTFAGCTTLQNQYGSDMASALMHRFDNFPIHKKYYHASVTTIDELAREIELSMQSSQEGNTTTSDHLVDPFGMAPFHFLLSAANCRTDLLQVLLNAYPPNVIGWKDVNGKTAIEYLTQRSFHLDEDARTMLRRALQRWLVGSISSWNGFESWKSDMTDRMNAIVAEHELERRQSLLRETSMALSRYERIEATTLLELLSLWKNEMKAAIGASAENAVDKDNREANRIRSGASVIIPNVLIAILSNVTS